MYTKQLKDMNLLDDFLFFSMMNYPEIGEKFSRNLVETIFNRAFGELEIVPQRVFYGEEPDKHGIRMDVYLEESESIEEMLNGSTIFDIEPDLKSDSKSKRALPKRMRFSHAKIDVHELKSGKDYTELKNVIIIMITPFDPFGFDQKIYTISRSCKEVPEMDYDDGDKTIFLYAKGKYGDISSELQEMLHYMEDTRVENATNDKLQELQKMVDIVKGDAEVAKKSMRIDEKLKDAREEGILEGRIILIKKKLAKNQSIEQIAEALEEDVETIKKLVEELK